MAMKPHDFEPDGKVPENCDRCGHLYVHEVHEGTGVAWNKRRVELRGRATRMAYLLAEMPDQQLEALFSLVDRGAVDITAAQRLGVNGGAELRQKIREVIEANMLADTETLAMRIEGISGGLGVRDDRPDRLGMLLAGVVDFATPGSLVAQVWGVLYPRDGTAPSAKSALSRGGAEL